MPRIKTIAPGRLSGISGLTKEAALGVKQQKDFNYRMELQEWQTQKARIDEVQKQEQNQIAENIKLVTGNENLGSETFDDSVRDEMYKLAVDNARINSKMKLGDIDQVAGAKEIGGMNNVLDTFGKFVPNINALNKKLQEAPEDGFSVGAVVVPFGEELDKGTANIVTLVKDMYSKDKNGEVKYSVKNGQSIVTHSNGAEISLQGLNDVMSGENPEYPITFVQDFSKAVEPIVATMIKKNKSKYMVKHKTQKRLSNGDVETVVEDKFDISEGSLYMKDLNKAMDVFFEDKNSMMSYWPNIDKEERTPWLNTDTQKADARKLMAKQADDYWGPKNDIISNEQKLAPSITPLQRQQLKLQQDKLNFEQNKLDTQKADAAAAKLNSPTSYVDRQRNALETAFNLTTGGNVNKDAIKDIINTEISKVSGIEPKSITFNGDDLTIITEKSTGKNAYTKKESKIINDAAGVTLISEDGSVIDETQWNTFKKQNAVPQPSGKPIEKPGKTIVINNYRSASGEAELLNLMVDNRFSTAKDKNEALTEIERLTGVRKEQEASGAKSAEQIKIQKANLKALKIDAKAQSNNEQLVSFSDPGSNFSKNAINFFKSLPNDFKIDTFDYGEITVEEYLSKPSIKLGDLYNHYASAYEKVVKNASEYPDAILNYTSVQNIKKDNKKPAYTKKT